MTSLTSYFFMTFRSFSTGLQHQPLKQYKECSSGQTTHQQCTVIAAWMATVVGIRYNQVNSKGVCLTMPLKYVAAM